ncbi:hypothetical protein BsWGS_10485 [Bradybaena similaris]
MILGLPFDVVHAFIVDLKCFNLPVLICQLSVQVLHTCIFNEVCVMYSLRSSIQRRVEVVRSHSSSLLFSMKISWTGVEIVRSHSSSLLFSTKISSPQPVCAPMSLRACVR